MITRVKPINSSTDSLTEKGESEKPNFFARWKEFTSETTVHGLRHVFQDGLPISRRATWLILLCIAGSAYIFYGHKSLRNYMSKPTKTVVSQETSSDGLKFPAVTICNLNMFMKSKIDVADDDENFEKLELNISGCNEIRVVRGNLTCGQAMLCAYGWFGPALVKGCNETTQRNIIDALNHSSDRLFDEEEFLTKYGHDISDMFVGYCRYMEDEICSDKDFVTHLSPVGSCFTFNSGRKSSVRRAEFEGSDRGLNILLDVQTNESSLSLFSNGLKVIVHDQDTFINRHSGFDVLPGTQVSVAVKLRKHVRLPAPFKTKCQQEKLPGIGSYTKDGCIDQCITNMTLAHCGCRRLGLPDPKSAPLCSLQDEGCVQSSRRQINLEACSCSNACSELEYESRVSYSKFPSNPIIEILHQFYGDLKSDSYMKENYVFLQVGFQRLAFEQFEDIPSYGTESLLGEWGGNMGLFLGCSLLTLCEFIDFLWEVVMAKIRKRSEAMTPNPDSNS